MAAHTGYYSESASFDNVNQAVAQAELYKDQAAASATAAAGTVATVQASATAADSSAQSALASATTATNSSQTATSASISAGASASAAATSATSAASSAAAVAAQTLFSFKNKIMNGALTIQQRGGYYGMTTGQAFPADRWQSENNGAGGQMGVQVSNMPVNSISIPALQASTVQVMQDSSGVKFWSPFCQRIEGYNMMDLLGNAVTVSFRWLSSISGTFCVSLGDTAKSCVQTFTAVGGVVQKVTLTFPALPLTLNSQFSNTVGLILRIGAINTGTYSCPVGNLGTWQNSVYISTNSATNWALTVNANVNVSEIQLELGGVATPFERRLFQVELALCQRYFVAGSSRFDGYGQSGCGYSVPICFPVNMRALPTISQSSTAQTNFPSTTGNAGATSKGFADYRTCNNTGAATWTTSYTADAEL